MSKETDAIVGYFIASGCAGKITDINTPGVHAKRSCHYWKATHAEPWGLDHSPGNVGCAVDFAFVPRQVDTPALRRIFDAFLPQASKLAELYHSSAPVFVKNGEVKPIAQLDKSIRDTHHDHVHVGVRKGTFLKWDGVPMGSEDKEEEVPDYVIVTSPYGGYWSVRTVDGGVGNYDGAPHFGAVPQFNIKLNAPVVSLTPFIQDNAVRGYWLVSQDGGVFAFGKAPFLGAAANHPEWGTPGAKFYGLEQTSGFDSEHMVRYKLLRRESSTADYKFQYYEFPIAG